MIDELQIQAGDVRSLLLFLRGRGWVTRRMIRESHTGSPVEQWSARKIRAVGHASGGRVVSGQEGYKLTRDASDTEVAHTIRWLRSQAREMHARASAIEAYRSTLSPSRLPFD
jgi:hypothetical protein